MDGLLLSQWLHNIETHCRTFFRGIHRWPENSPHKGPVILTFCTLCFSLLTWTNRWITVELYVIWDAMAFIWRHNSVSSDVYIIKPVTWWKSLKCIRLFIIYQCILCRASFLSVNVWVDQLRVWLFVFAEMCTRFAHILAITEICDGRYHLTINCIFIGFTHQQQAQLLSSLRAAHLWRNGININ